MRLSSMAISLQIPHYSSSNTQNILNEPSLTSTTNALLHHKNEVITCIENLSLALASFLLYFSTRERMIANNGLEEVIRICKITSEPLILKSLAKIIVTVVPHPKELLVISCFFWFTLLLSCPFSFFLTVRLFIKIKINI
jgi:hypothetical protein